MPDLKCTLSPQAKRGKTASVTATQPVKASGTMRVATQPVEAPGAGTATQPVEALGARSEVHSQPTSTGSLDVRLDQSLASRKTVAVTGVSDPDD